MMAGVGARAKATNEELLVAARQSPEAFGQFYDRHVRDVMTYFERRTGCAHTSADLTAETFAQALCSIKRFKPNKGAAKAWLFGIAAHQLSHFLRHEAVSNRAANKLGIALPHHNVHDDDIERVDAGIDAAVAVMSLKDAWQELPTDTASAVRMRVTDGLAFDEIAERLGCSPGAARVRVSRGLSRLAEVADV